MALCGAFPFQFSPKEVFFIAFQRERMGERNGEKETSMWERSTDWLPLICTLTWNWTHNLGMWPDKESNLQLFGYGMTLQATAPHWPALCGAFKLSWLSDWEWDVSRCEHLCAPWGWLICGRPWLSTMVSADFEIRLRIDIFILNKVFWNFEWKIFLKHVFKADMDLHIYYF